jgi:hypothetical protein
MYSKRKILLQSLVLISGFNNTQGKNAIFEVSHKGGSETKKCDPDDDQHQLEEGAFHGSRSGPFDEGLFCKIVTRKFLPEILYWYLTKKKKLSSIKRIKADTEHASFKVLYSALCETKFKFSF